VNISRCIQRAKSCNNNSTTTKYENTVFLFLAHFFFDDAFDPHDEEEYEYRANDFVKQMVRVIDKAAS
jgi:hypothetical protein